VDGARSDAVIGGEPTLAYPDVAHVTSGCSATLIHPRALLTAGHCCQSASACKQVVLGGRRLATRPIVHPSFFIAPDAKQIEASARVGAQFIELHTGQFAENFSDVTKRDAELKRLIDGAKLAHSLGLQVNAGHGSNYENLAMLHRVPRLVELNIGHSIVSRAVFTGLSAAVKEMLVLMDKYLG